MFELADFYQYCRHNQIDVISYPDAPGPGVTIRDGEWYAIFLDFNRIRSARLLKGICCHELGHAATGALHKVDSPFETVGRSEHRAHRFVAEHYLREEDFREAFREGYTEMWQLAEYFDLPEEVIQSAYQYWTQNQGIVF